MVSMLSVMQPQMLLGLLAARAHGWLTLSLLPPALPGPFLQGCSPAAHLQLCPSLLHPMLILKLLRQSPLYLKITSCFLQLKCLMLYYVTFILFEMIFNVLNKRPCKHLLPVQIFKQTRTFSSHKTASFKNSHLSQITLPMIETI